MQGAKVKTNISEIKDDPTDNAIRLLREYSDEIFKLRKQVIDLEFRVKVLSLKTVVKQEGDK